MTESIYHLGARVEQKETSSIHLFSLVAESEEDAHHRAVEELANEGRVTIISCQKKG